MRSTTTYAVGMLLLTVCDDSSGRPDLETEGVTTTGHSVGTGAETGSPGNTTGDDAEGDLGSDLGADTTGSPTPAGECQTDLMATVRDFSQVHPDFEYLIALDPGIVEPVLGGDGKPIYAGGTAGTTTSAANFDQWYRDVVDVNLPFPLEIPLTNMGGVYVIDSTAFFPIDRQGFGNEGNVHNYHSTLEMHLQFTYQLGDIFKFRGDDDQFTFINGRLGIDLGGVHTPLEGVIDLDLMAAELGIVPGGTYDLDFFFAERHTNESNFRIETTIDCFAIPR